MLSKTETRNRCQSSSVYKKAIHEFQHSFACSKDWMQNLFTTSATYRSSLNNKKLNGYIQHTETDSSLEITTYSQLQFECLAKTVYEDRIMHIDATGQLVRVGDYSEIQKHADYKRILNYTVLVRNPMLAHESIRKFQLGKLIWQNCQVSFIFLIKLNASIFLAELISSSQTTRTLTTFLLRLKMTFEEIAKKSFNFRLVVSDFCWAVIHSAVTVLNGIEVSVYATRVFDFAHNRLCDEIVNSTSWLMTCCAHTMKRFSWSLKRIQINGII